MANSNRKLITDNFKEVSENRYEPTSQEYRVLIKELIRLDIPILEIGSSSIGKSYSIREFSEQSGVHSEFLFVGTEKSEFIEGIPNLKGVTEGTAKFEYLKPYWFPNKQEIRDDLYRGKQQLEELVNTNDTIRECYAKAFEGEMYDTNPENNINPRNNFGWLEKLKSELLKFKRSEEEKRELKKDESKKGDKVSKYIYSNALLYLSTIEGYGNFWLILDEIDKVEPQDKDKYAPLLHIVRERELKGWKLSGLRSYPEYDVKYVTRLSKRKERLDACLSDPNADVTDTRIIAIANNLDNLEKESPALYRRFIKLIIRQSLYQEKSKEDESKEVSQNDAAAIYDIDKAILHNCIVNKEIDTKVASSDSDSSVKRSGVANTKSSRRRGMTIGEQMAIIEKGTGKPLQEMNLQWTLGFLPDLLFPGRDTDTPDYMPNRIVADFNNTTDPYRTLFFKIIQDNFSNEYWKPLLECVYDNYVSSTEQTISTSKKQSSDVNIEEFFQEAGLYEKDFNRPSENSVNGLLSRYEKKLNTYNTKFKQNLDSQKSQSGSAGLEGIDKGLIKSTTDAVLFGNQIIERSLIENKPTELTKMLLSGIPFIQARFIQNSPYIPYNTAKDLLEVQESNMIALIQRVTNIPFKDAESGKRAVESFFKDNTPYRKFVVIYGLGFRDNIDNDVVESVINNDYKSVKEKAGNIEGLIDKVIENMPVIIDIQLMGLLPIGATKTKEKYLHSISNSKMIDKEVYANLPFELLRNTYDKDKLSSDLKRELDYYCEKYPSKMLTLANIMSDEEQDMSDYIESKANEVLANKDNYIISEIDMINS